MKKPQILEDVPKEKEVLPNDRATMGLDQLNKGELVVAQVIENNRLAFRRPFGDTCAVRQGRTCHDSIIFKNAA